MTTLAPTLRAGLIAVLLALTAIPSHADDWDDDRYQGPQTILNKLLATDGTQALVAAVLVVDEFGTLPFSLADLLADRREEVILFAPTNTAFEKLLGLEPGFLDGLSVQDIAAALPGIVDGLGLTVGDVQAILLQHAALPRKANRRTASEAALLRAGSVEVAAECLFPISIGNDGVRINYESIIVRGDQFARNGVVHFVNSVIVDARGTCEEN
jgi:uncharacterized surface protein with fasciclin (FAS1) repeats